MEIIKQLISLRKERGYSQRELAERSGIDASQLAKIERGYNSPSIATLTKLAEALESEIKLIVKHS